MAKAMKNNGDLGRSFSRTGVLFLTSYFDRI